jgi:crotonobetainyl-CoA:carnitine CoA-transferase CaiB-like acyl-CoA transferase
MLSPYRVLDLTTERGLLCGQILGDLGADVVKVEPPGGSAARRLAPFAGGEPHPDRSLTWWAFNRNKRGITLDLDTDDGRALMRRLAARADFLIESDAPGAHAVRGLGYEALAAANPALVYVSISPFGQDGPKAGYADTDLVMMAAGGPLLLAGDEDRPPVRVSVPQAYLHAAAEAAVAALIAHHERQRSGRGQHVDVSVQQAVAFATQSTILAAEAGPLAFTRIAGGARLGPLTGRFVWPARDGHVSITLLFGSSFGKFTRRLMEWVHAEGFCDAATRDKDWIGYFDLLFSGAEPVEEYERVKATLARFTATKTKRELFAAAQARGLLIAPVATTAELVASEQLAARDYWRTVAHPELGRAFLYPGPFARTTAAPIAYRRRPPTVGEHNEEIYVGELGLAPEELAALRARRIV